MSAAVRGRVLFLVTEDWYFRSHRQDLAERLVDAGFDVVVGTRINAPRADDDGTRFRMVHVPFERSLRAPARDAASLRAIVRLLRDERPDIVHLVALKPVLLGGLALRLHPGAVGIAALTGLGYLFSSADRLATVLRPVVVALLRRLVRRPDIWLLVQNPDDAALLRASGIEAGARTAVIRGAGVDPDRFSPAPQPQSDVPVVLLPARLLVDKGIREYAEAARLVAATGREVRFVVAGAHDADNPGAVTARELERWIDDGVIEWLGPRDDMPAVYAAAHVVCLPSHREGLPKVLLEAGACERAIVATDVPGCREVCRDGETGLLVPVADPAALARAVCRLLDDAELCARLARNARALVMAEFSADEVARRTVELYERALAARRVNPA